MRSPVLRIGEPDDTVLGGAVGGPAGEAFDAGTDEVLTMAPPPRSSSSGI